MPRMPILSVVGSDTQAAVADAKSIGALAAADGWVVLTGGRDSGVMDAALDGAKNNGGMTVGVLPHSRSEVSSNVDIAIITDLNNARNNVVGLSSNVVIACGVDGPGTASEVALALKNGKPVVLLNASPAAIAFFKAFGSRLLHSAATPAAAMAYAARYK